jgi:NADH-quinone oxidoreductase subunit J
MQSLHLLLVFLLIICSFLVFLSHNPVHSVLFLILTFCNAASILFLFNVDFLGVLFIIIYVGAIAVLFLFVVMMLNVKIYSFKNFSYISIIFLCSIILLVQIFLNVENTFFNINTDFNNQYFLFERYLDNLVNIDVFGQALYNYYLICFLIAGLILLVSMVGAIVLTLKFRSNRKSELVFRQLSRSDKFLSFFR